VNFHGEKRSNRTHESTTDPEAKLARKGDGKEAKLSYSGNLLVENRNGLIVNAMAWEANGTAERDTALLMLEQIPGQQRLTVGGDKGFDTANFVAECRHMQVTPHVAQNDKRRGGSAIDERTTRHESYRISQKKRKRIEECFGWLKTIACCAKFGIVGCTRWTGCSPLHARLTIWCACGTCQFNRCSSRPKCVRWAHQMFTGQQQRNQQDLVSHRSTTD
jgi:hypothetical protein